MGRGSANMCMSQQTTLILLFFQVGILKGSLAEAQENWKEAERIYKAQVRCSFQMSIDLCHQELKEKDETLPAPRKRLVALHKARNNPEAAAFELVEYLDTFMTDAEAWMELTNLYLAADQYSHASYW